MFSVKLMSGCAVFFIVNFIRCQVGGIKQVNVFVRFHVRGCTMTIVRYAPKGKFVMYQVLITMSGVRFCACFCYTSLPLAGL